jgi:TonB family protein
VVDSETRRPAVVPVEVLADSNHVVGSTQTDSAGIFYAMLAAGGRYHLRFLLDSATTFESDTIAVRDSDFVEREFLLRLPRVSLERGVREHVRLRSGSGTPHYPPVLGNLRYSGDVVVRFVVDSAGRPRLDTFHVLRSTDLTFTAAVRDWLRTARFAPARSDGHPVAEEVQLPFTFSSADDGNGRVGSPTYLPCTTLASPLPTPRARC